MMSARLPNSIVYRIFVYKSKDEPGAYVAHCLEVDLVGVGECVESAITELLENIDTQTEICLRNGTPFFVPAPPTIWKGYKAALKAGRWVCQELADRITDDANKRLGHKPPTFDERVVASKQVPVGLLGV